jgi:RNA polymerase sigma-70 factor (ECF subfamily)
MPANPDRETLALLRRRDPRGFDQAYAAYGSRLYGFLCRLVGREERHLADDFLQQTFLRLAEHGPELRADSDLRAWLYTVARNAFLGHLRGRRHNGEHPNLELVADYSADVEARLLLGDVEQALGQLRVDDRELLLLVGVEGLEPQAVARMLGIDPVTLRKRLARARRRLFQELERQAPAGAHKEAIHDRA